MTDEQEWCLRCGAAAATRIATAQGWRVPLVLTGLLVALAAIAIAIASTVIWVEEARKLVLRRLGPGPR